MKCSTTHHHACACREEYVRKLEVVARACCKRYWEFDKSMKAEVQALEAVLAVSEEKRDE